MNPPDISIVIPVLNGQDQLSSCLSSVLKQDYPAELIIIDDGSTDRSLEVLKNIVGGRSNVRILVHQENQGLGKTLNEGIKQARGEYLLIVHQDCEILEPDFLGKAVKIMESRDDVAAVTGRRMYRLGELDSKEKLFMVANGHLAEMENDGNEVEDVPFVEHKCDVFRKSLLESIGGFPGTRFKASGEDQVVSSRLRASGYRLVRAGGLTYNLGFGSKESSFKGIFGKIWVYGKTQAGVLISEKASALRGISKSKAFLGRMLNRLEMIVAASLLVYGIILSFASPWFIFLPVAVAVLRIASYGNRLRKVGGKIRLALFGPLLDIVYSVGFTEGLVARSLGRQL